MTKNDGKLPEQTHLFPNEADSSLTPIFSETDSIPLSVKKELDFRDTSRILSQNYSKRYSSISHMLRVDAKKLDSFLTKMRNKSNSNIRDSSSNSIVFPFSGIGNIEIFIDSIYRIEKVLKADVDFEIVTCHTKGYWRSANQLTWKKGHLGGQINMENIGEVQIWSFEDGYYQLAILRKDYYKPD
jgi:ppGpp synthetase/RelA/SpoT-type nucleotidyltranferase